MECEIWPSQMMEHRIHNEQNFKRKCCKAQNARTYIYVCIQYMPDSSASLTRHEGGSSPFLLGY